MGSKLSRKSDSESGDIKEVPDDVEDEIDLELLKIDPYAMTTTSESSSLHWEKKGMEAADEWISGFCALPGNEYFCEVDPTYILDKFYTYGLKPQLKTLDYQHALDRIVSKKLKKKDLFDKTAVEAAILYGRIHARYLWTEEGIMKIWEKSREGVYGQCQRIFCEKQNMLPIGISDIPTECDVKLYCPRCKQVFDAPSDRLTRLDGAYFGQSFPHLLFMVHPELRPLPSEQNEKYENRIHGFKIHPKGYEMKWEEMHEKNMAPEEKEKRFHEIKRTAVTFEPRKQERIELRTLHKKVRNLSPKEFYGKKISQAVKTVSTKPSLKSTETPPIDQIKSKISPTVKNTVKASRVTFPIHKATRVPAKGKSMEPRRETPALKGNSKPPRQQVPPKQPAKVPPPAVPLPVKSKAPAKVSPPAVSPPIESKAPAKVSPLFEIKPPAQQSPATK